MQRFHVHLSVTDLARSVAFYTRLFGVGPNVEKPDYAKWMLEDPRVNFALSTRGARAGVDHVGLQADDDEDFARLRGRLSAAETPVLDQPEVTCCYARSTKAWVYDPDGLAWESFVSRGESAVYGDGSRGDVRVASESSPACCAPARVEQPSRTSTGCCGGES